MAKILKLAIKKIYPNCQHYTDIDPSVNTQPHISCPESDSGISFSKLPVIRHLFYNELHSFSTFFALNFDKKLAVE
jgi:hypothetical protein